MSETNEHIWMALQICDSCFPGGALANSNGLESAIGHGLVSKNSNNNNNNNRESLKSYISLVLDQTVHLLLPFVRTAHQIALVIDNNNQISRHHLLQLDSFCQCVLNNEVSRRASTNQGKCFLRVISETFPQELKDITTIINNINMQYFNFAPIFGIVCGSLGLSLQLTDKLFMRMTLRDLISAAARLNTIGPMDGSYLQAQFGKFIEINYLSSHIYNEKVDNDKINNNNSINSCNNSSDNSHQNDNNNNNDESNNEVIVLGSPILFYQNIKPVQTSPVTDFLQSRQDLLYSRLFNS